MRRMWSVTLVLTCALLSATCLPGQTQPVKQGAVSLNSDPHLMTWLKFDEVTGNEVQDASGQKHVGILEGNSTLASNRVAGKIGAALRLDGKELSVRIPNFKGVTGQSPRTVALWLKTAAQSGELVSWGSEEAGKKFTFGFFRSRVGVIPKGGYLYMNAPVHDEQWHHVAVVVLPASPPNLHDHVKLFKDGERAEIGDIGLLDLWPIDTGEQLEVRIGRRFNGALDDVRIYDRALSEDEITALFKQQSKH